MHAIVPLLLCVLSAVPAAQDLTREEREELHERFLNTDPLIRGGSIRARWLDDGSSLWFRDGRTSIFCDPAAGELREATREDRAREVDVENPVRRGRTHAPGIDRWFKHGADGNLVVGGEGIDGELVLTDNAGEDFYWAAGARAWSADGAFLYAAPLDARGVHHVPIVDYLSAEEGLTRHPYVKSGGKFAEYGIVVFHLPSGARVDVDLGTEEDVYVWPIGWRGGSEEVLFLRMARNAKRLDLMAADPATGASRVILTDTQETFVGGLDFITGGYLAYHTPLPESDRFLWLSERDGWRHVYLYDYDGKLISRVTSGEFPVVRVVGVDEERGRVFVLANAEERLYDTHLYRVGLEGEGLARLTVDIGEHEVELSPSKLFFVDTHSALDRPPCVELRDVDGRWIARLTEADASGLDEIGWMPPEPFVVKADDGLTDLHGVLYKPVDFDPTRRYPVIDFIYSGPFITVVPNDFRQRSFMARQARAMAQMGFITFVVDPRGTTERSKAFQDASFGRIGQIEIPDHVATVRQLAATRPYMDLERVGVRGGSWGGYFTLRAMLTAPDVFRVGVCAAPGDLTEAASINEPYMDLPVNNPEGYAVGSNPALAANLEGKLLIIHGTADVNAPFSTTMRMVNALVEADKPFDLLVLPGATHYFEGKQFAYAMKRTRSYFLEHLAGR